MPARTNDFQQLILKIYESLKDDKALVSESGQVWDADGRILREVDILIEEDCEAGRAICMVECRGRSRKESIQWIDELIGKSKSLNVDKVVAVSSKGFAESALRKAAANNIETITLVECLDSELPFWKGEHFLIVDSNYNFHIMGVHFFNINSEFVEVPDQLKDYFVRKRGTEDYIKFSECIDHFFKRSLKNPKILKVLRDAVDSNAKEYRQYIVSEQKMPAINKSIFLNFSDYFFYDVNKQKLPLRVFKMQLLIMVSMGLYKSKTTHYRFSGNYVSTYDFRAERKGGGLRVVYVRSGDQDAIDEPGANSQSLKITSV